MKRFVNLLSNAGLWHDDVVGWNRIPCRSETLLNHSVDNSNKKY